MTDIGLQEQNTTNQQGLRQQKFNVVSSGGHMYYVHLVRSNILTLTCFHLADAFSPSD